MHQFDLLYMPGDELYGNKYKYILTGVDVASRYKVARPLRTKKASDVADMLKDIYKAGPLTYPKIFQCDNGSEFKGKVACKVTCPNSTKDAKPRMMKMKTCIKGINKATT